MEESKKGGARSNAGRKPTDDPKIPITVYIKTSVVEKNGGRVELAQRIIDTVDSDFVANPIMERIKEPIPKPFKKGLPKSIKTEYKPPTDLEKEFEELLKQNKDGK